MISSMSPIKKISGNTVDDVSIDELIGTLFTLEDLYSEFQGSGFSFLLISLAIPLCFFSVIFLGYARIDDIGMILIASIFVGTTAFLAISLHSFHWMFSIQKRIQLVKTELEILRED